MSGRGWGSHMGSMGKRRYRRTRASRGGGGPHLDQTEIDLGPWARTRSPYLVEERIADYGRFARGLNRATGWRRTAGLVLVAVTLGGSAIVMAAVGIARLISR